MGLLLGPGRPQQRRLGSGGRPAGLHAGADQSQDGRIRPGDIGYLDPDGYLYLTGRTRELIIRGGVNISPLEIDSFLMQHADVIEAATVGVPDPEARRLAARASPPGVIVAASEKMRASASMGTRPYNALR